MLSSLRLLSWEDKKKTELRGRTVLSRICLKLDILEVFSNRLFVTLEFRGCKCGTI